MFSTVALIVHYQTLPNSTVLSLFEVEETNIFTDSRYHFPNVSYVFLLCKLSAGIYMFMWSSRIQCKILKNDNNKQTNCWTENSKVDGKIGQTDKKDM